MSQISYQERRPEKIVARVRALGEGRTLAAGQVTLRANETSTTVTNTIISAACYPTLFPATSAAAGVVATTYIASVESGAFTIAHASSASTDLTFNWTALGG